VVGGGAGLGGARRAEREGDGAAEAGSHTVVWLLVDRRRSAFFFVCVR
jgi:hypothetical protein